MYYLGSAGRLLPLEKTIEFENNIERCDGVFFNVEYGILTNSVPAYCQHQSQWCTIMHHANEYDYLRLLKKTLAWVSECVGTYNFRFTSIRYSRRWSGALGIEIFALKFKGLFFWNSRKQSKSSERCKKGAGPAATTMLWSAVRRNVPCTPLSRMIWVVIYLYPPLFRSSVFSDLFTFVMRTLEALRVW